jgi:hypothetical protein
MEQQSELCSTLSPHHEARSVSTPRACRVTGCTLPDSVAFGLCRTHYQAAYRALKQPGQRLAKAEVDAWVRKLSRRIRKQQTI